MYNQRNADELENQEQTVFCQVCRKNFGNSNAFSNHLNSKKHKENEKIFTHNPNEKPNREQNLISAKKDEDSMSVDSEIEEVGSDEWDDIDNPIDNNECLFCSEQSQSFIKNLDHMTTKHSFFIPDIEFCSDMEGLLRYLGEKVSQGILSKILEFKNL